MPVRITATARDQYRGIIRRYLQALPNRPARPTAAAKLFAAYEVAIVEIAQGPKVSFGYPRPYPMLAGYEFRWIKVHRYWFGYVPGTNPIITNVFDEVADIPAHVSGDQTSIDPA